VGPHWSKSEQQEIVEACKKNHLKRIILRQIRAKII
jgi:hypothetical protein